jgi:hypothetical protein
VTGFDQVERWSLERCLPIRQERICHG